MSTPAELKSMLQDAAGRGTGAIDVARVIRLSGRRRTAQKVTIGGVTTLAVAGIGVAGFAGLRLVGPQQAITAISSSDGSSTAPDAGDSSGFSAPSAPGATGKRIPADRLNLCGQPIREPSSSIQGLTVTAQFPEGAASDPRISGTVTLTNAGTETITGSSAASPLITLSQNGITVWHSTGPVAMIAAVVNLAPGESMTYQASFEPTVCTDEGAAPGAEHLPAGDYQVSAILQLTRDSAAASEGDLVIGQTSNVHLR